MSVIACIYHYVNVAFGVVNIYFEPSTNTYKLYHWPTLIYCFALNLVTLFGQQLATNTYWNVNLYCEELKPLIIIDMFLLFTNYAAIVVIIVESWLKRQRVYRVFNIYKNLFKYYLSTVSINEYHNLVMHTRNLLLRKCLCSLCKIIILYLHLVEKLRGPKCDKVNANYYAASSIYFAIIVFYSVLVDINIYMGLVFIYMCVQMLMQRLWKIERDVKLMHRLQRSKRVKNIKLHVHTKWREKLRHDIRIIARDERKLKGLAEEFFRIFQLQLLLLLMCFFLNLIALMFFVLKYLANFQNVDIIELLFLLFVVTTNITNVLLFYNICELLLRSFKEIVELVYETSIYASLGTREMFRRDDLVLSLELFLLQLQYRDLNLSVCGLFNIKNSTCLAMLSSVVLNLLYLLQSVVKLMKL